MFCEFQNVSFFGLRIGWQVSLGCVKFMEKGDFQLKTLTSFNKV
uniref:Uncharacterized protein n=1 Tax=Anguilla anguilla TaxID=7936 RepID=A0A0E9UY14_ANGAN